MDIIFTLLVFLFDYDAPISLVSVIPETVNEDEKFEHRMLFNDANGRREASYQEGREEKKGWEISIEL